MTDEARRSRAVEERLRRNDRALAAALSGTFAGTLVELLETRAPVSIRTRAENTVHGTIADLGPDVVVVSSSDSSQRVLLRSLAIEALVEQGPGHDRVVGPIETGPGFAELLDGYGEEHERLALILSSGNRLVGQILRVGEDQVVLRLDGDADTVTVPLFAIDQVVLAR